MGTRPPCRKRRLSLSECVFLMGEGRVVEGREGWSARTLGAPFSFFSRAAPHHPTRHPGLPRQSRHAAARAYGTGDKGSSSFLSSPASHACISLFSLPISHLGTAAAYAAYPRVFLPMSICLRRCSRRRGSVSRADDGSDGGCAAGVAAALDGAAFFCFFLFFFSREFFSNSRAECLLFFVGCATPLPSLNTHPPPQSRRSCPPWAPWRGRTACGAPSARRVGVFPGAFALPTAVVFGRLTRRPLALTLAKQFREGGRKKRHTKRRTPVHAQPPA
jgi:hypothetical protein